MMNENTTKLQEDFQRKKKELSKLRTELNSQHTIKETAFNDLKVIRENIKAHNTSIKKIKSERDMLTKEVKTLKKERDRLNSVVKEKSSAQKEATGKKKEVFNDSQDPKKIKFLIAKLEEKIETEVIPFTQEQALTKQLKDLKTQYKAIESKVSLIKEINTITTEFSQKRKQAQDSHYKVQEKAQQSQEKHNQINKLFEEIKKWRGEEQTLAAKSFSLKAEYEQTKKKLDEIAKEVKKLSEHLQENKQQNFNDKANEKTVEVEKKMKSGKKLSMDDILTFQAIKG